MIDVALHADERQRIASALGREPTRVELYAFDAQWSEHCSYKSSRAQLRRLPVSGEDVVVGPGEDAGVLRLGEHDGEFYCVVVAHESHNHPSQVVPFEGAATGVGGIVRDVLCMGAQVVGIADALRFGDVSDPAGHPRHVARAVVDGISAYGNAIGVPNLAGDVHFHRGFDENCLVNVVALGIVKENEIVHSRAPAGSSGWPLLLVGKATDHSGFGGAAFSSLTLDGASEVGNRGAVQVPDPFLKSVLMRACYRVFALLRERGAVFACKDLGAGGIMGCSAEICAAGGYGASIDLDRVNVAQEGLPAEVIAVGETQERMLFVVAPEMLDDVLAVFNDEFSLPQIAYNARAVVIGAVTQEKRYVLVHRGERVMDVDIEVLTTPPEVPPPRYDPIAPATKTTPGDREALPQVTEALYRRYDSVVRGCTVLPRGYGDAGVVAPIPGSHLGVAIAVAGDPEIGSHDPRLAAEYAVLEAVRSVAAVGACPVGLTDCLNFGNPTKPEHYAQFVAAVDGLVRGAGKLNLPFVSGNVSLYNEGARGEAVPPSAIVACVGVLEDVRRVVTPGLKAAGALLVAIDDITELQRMMADDRVAACAVACSEGLVPAVARMAFASAREGRALGAELHDAAPDDGFVAFVVEIAAGEHHAGRVVGRVVAEPVVRSRDRREATADLYAAWSERLTELYA